MTNKDFREEISAYMNKTYDEFNGFQKITMETLVEFDRVCQKNRIDYYMAYGSMLGAIRDHGQIPWDYDIDTFVKIDDRERLLKVLKQDLGENFYYDYSDINPTYPTSCLRLCKKGYTMMALHVDVFFLIGTPNDEEKRKSFIKRAESSMSLVSSKFLSLYIEEKPQGRLISLIQKLQLLFYKLIPAAYVRWNENRILYKYPLKESEFWYSYQHVYDYVYPSHIFNSVERVNVNGHSLCVPCGYEEFLTINYKRWKEYLPIRNRFEEFYKMKGIVEERQSSFMRRKGNC